MNVIREVYFGFRDFCCFTCTINDLNKEVESAVKKYKEKSSTEVYSKWVMSKKDVKPKKSKETPKGIYDSIRNMYIQDSIVLMVALVLILFTSFVWSYLKLFLEMNFQSKWILLFERCIHIFVQVVWRLILTIIVELINMVHIKRLTSNIHIMLSETTQDHIKRKSNKVTRQIQSPIMSRLHIYSFFIMLPLQLLIFDYILPWDFLRATSRLLHNSILYSFYSFDNPWTKEGVYFEDRLKLTIEHMPYLLGYGLFVGSMQMMWPEPFGIGAVITIFTYPLLVVNAYRVDWRRLKNVSVNSQLQYCAKCLLRPSLYGCRMICAICDRIFEYLSQ